MTNEYHGPGSGPSGSDVPGADGWQPVPPGEYDSDATAFVQLPPEGFPETAPLAAPGHNYVPPQITVSPATGAAAVDPAATGVWVLPPELTGAAPEQPAQAPQPEPQPAHPEHAEYQTGQWSIPVVSEGELADDSGEFTTSSIAEQWGDRNPPPATLPGGATAPWAHEAWAQPDPVPDPDPEPAPVREEVPEAEAEPQAEPAAVPAAEPAEPAESVEPAPSVEPGELAEPVELVEPVAPVEPVDPAAEAAAEPTADGTPGDAAAEPDAPAAPVATPLHDDHPLVSYVLRVNGSDRPVTDAWIGESLLYVLRERLGLAGAKDGCSQGECGACNVQVDGRLVASCLVPAATTAGSEVRTVEGLAADGQPSDVQRALTACGAVQCGFCVPGMAMTVHDLLEGNPDPSDLEARQALCGNLCRCSGYRGVLDAVRQVTAERKASAEAAETAEADGPGASEAGEPRIPHQGGPVHGEGVAPPLGESGPFGDSGTADGAFGDFRNGGQA
ncbi:2Fe-2S iron-sulfur cluster-binding protein [Streptomyces xanthii]|uniref:(2Fe-2S)-binding protein n=1 Tax=Streptomyces xanthii TaxID=2768069 RepID=A0A7H1BB31_9ACTN|nr:(2Fe-2S)-binding protein [Streptomyces xanthii]QNS05936.1 (2Fe-2S)-binding protein [Streptomyces xanthii]